MLYKKKDKEVQRSASKDKRFTLETKATSAEEAARKDDFKTFYHLTNKIIWRDTSRNTVVKHENGVILLDPDKIDDRLVVKFEKLSHRPRPSDQENVADFLFIQLEIYTDPPKSAETLIDISGDIRVDINQVSSKK